MMKLNFSTTPAKSPAVRVLFVQEKDKKPAFFSPQPELQKTLDRLSEAGQFGGKAEQSHLFQTPEGEGWLLVGVGGAKPHPERPAAERLRRLGAAVAKNAGKGGGGSAQVQDVEALAQWAGLKPAEAVEALAVGAQLALYSYDRYKSKKKDDKPKTLTLHLPAKGAEAALKRAGVVGAAVRDCRDLQATPPNVAFPAYLAKEARKVAEHKHVKLKVYGKTALKEKKCVGLLTVGGGSQHEPEMLVLDYNPPGARVTLGLVGKAITFDTGGISLKPGAKMHEMKYDKSGGCVVLRTVAAAAALGLNVRLVAIITAAENMPSGTAARPGDIITYRNGKTVEILNTDAEGRLVLADGLIEIGQFKPHAVIDLATLTGLCAMTFGPLTAGLMSNHQPLSDALFETGRRTGERVWPLPMWEEYGDYIKAEHADIQNIGGPSGGTITAAHFLKHFVPEKTPWAHLDIAGVAWGDFKSPYTPKGPSGFGVRLLLDFIEHHAQQLPAMKKEAEKV